MTVPSAPYCISWTLSYSSIGKNSARSWKEELHLHTKGLGQVNIGTSRGILGRVVSGVKDWRSKRLF